MAKDAKGTEEPASSPAPAAPAKPAKPETPAVPPPVKPARFRMHPYGGLDHDGAHYPAGEELPMTEDDIRLLGLDHCVERITD